MHEHKLPKSIKTVLRSLCGLAHEAELCRALEALRQDFDGWGTGEISPFELADRIHQFHEGVNREIYSRYAGGVDLRFLVSRALREGLINKESVPENVMPYLIEAVKAKATLGEICTALKEVFGTYREPVVL